MINTLIAGLGNIGFKFDKKDIKKKITHSSAIHYHKKFKLIAGVDKNIKALNEFKKIYNVPVFNNLKNSLSQIKAELIIFTYKPNLKEIIQVSKHKNTKFILIEKPFLKNLSEIKKILKILNKENINFTLNFQRNFSLKYLKLIKQIQNGVIGDKFKVYCYYNNNFFSNGTHFLNLINLFLKKIKYIKKIDNKKDNLHLNFKNGDVYFFKVNEKEYNNNSVSIFGNKGKIEISSRPEKCEIYKKVRDNLYENYFVLKKFKLFNLESKEIQRPILDNIYNIISKNKKILFDEITMLEYIKIINKINSL